MHAHSQSVHSSMPGGRFPPALCGTTGPKDFAALLGEGTHNTLQALLDRAVNVAYGPHEVLYHEGSACDTVYFTTSGFLKLIIHQPNGRARIVRLHRPGSILCLNGLFSRRIEHTAVAITAVSARRLPVSAVQRLRNDDPAAYVGLLERCCGYLHDADTWIAQFSSGPIRGRVARLLSFLSTYEAGEANGHVQLLTCEEMGSILGVRTESVSRVLAEFKRRQILADNGGAANRIYAPDLDRLRHIAEE